MIDNYNGPSFPGNIVFMGYVFLIAGMVMLFMSPLFGLFLLLLGGFASLSYNRIQIDPQKDSYREFTSIAGITSGKWLNLSSFEAVSVLMKNERYSSFSKTNISISSNEQFFDVCLLSRDHRTQLLVKRLKNKEQALEYAKDLASQLKRPFVKYDPPLSESTKLRRR